MSTTPPSHQTVRLAAGSHSSPDDGTCAMELASMLAGEPFSDRPLSVSPVIASFMRSYNDRVGDERRNELYAHAARAVGTRGDRGTEEQRARLCMRWARDYFDPPPLHVRVLHRLLRWQAHDLDGVYAARAAVAASDRENTHRLALALIDQLVALDGDDGDERQLVQAGLTGASTDGSYAARSSLHQTSSRARRSATPTNG